MMEEHQININGQDYLVKPYRDHGKNAIAKLRGSIIYIKIPRHWGNEFAWKISEKLKSRMVKRINSGNIVRSEPSFYKFENISVLGCDFTIEKIVEERKTSMARVIGNKIAIKINSKLTDNERIEVVDELVRKAVSKELLPKIIAKVDAVNNLHFQSLLGKISIRQQSSRWGSCSASNNISINFSLLFLPSEILEYVIVHELAHTKVRNHSERFWSIVEKAMPDFKERRRWLKKEARRELNRIFK